MPPPLSRARAAHERQTSRAQCNTAEEGAASRPATPHRRRRRSSRKADSNERGPSFLKHNKITQHTLCKMDLGWKGALFPEFQPSPREAQLLSEVNTEGGVGVRRGKSERVNRAPSFIYEQVHHLHTYTALAARREQRMKSSFP